MNIEEIKKTLEDLCQKDQELRNEATQDSKIWDDVGKHDIKSTKILKHIIKKIGFPKISVVGDKASFNAWLLVQHSKDLEFQKEYLELMKNNPNEVDPKNAAYLEDRILMYQNMPQKYGTQAIYNESTKKYEAYTLEDKEKTINLRNELGLEPLEDYIASLNNCI